MEVTSYGSDVPIATITIPITVVDMPKPSAIPIEPLIVNMPPPHNAAAPIMINTIGGSLYIFLSTVS